LDLNPLVTQIFIQAGIDLNQEIDGLRDYLRVLTVQGNVPNYIKLIELIRGYQELKDWGPIFFLLLLLVVHVLIVALVGESGSIAESI
jgi:hypothetical protein